MGASGSITPFPGRDTSSGAPRRACCVICITWYARAWLARTRPDSGLSIALLRGFAFFQDAPVQGVAASVDRAGLQRRHHAAAGFAAVRAVVEAAVFDLRGALGRKRVV